MNREHWSSGCVATSYYYALVREDGVVEVHPGGWTRSATFETKIPRSFTSAFVFRTLRYLYARPAVLTRVGVADVPSSAWKCASN
jgi:hypothetical protein